MKRKIVDFNFKVSADFRREFKRLALDMDITCKELLFRIFEAYEPKKRHLDDDEPTKGKQASSPWAY